MITSTILLVGYRDQGQAAGISQMFELLAVRIRKMNIPCKVIDLTTDVPTKTVGAFNLKRALKLSGIIIKAWLSLFSVKTVYMTVGLSRLGFFRDAAILWPAIILGRSTIIHIHSGGYGEFYHSESKIIKFLIRHTLYRVNRIIVLSNLLKEQFDFLPGYQGKIDVVYNGLSLGLDNTQRKPRTLDRNKKLNILYLSNMIRSKGYYDVLEACRILTHKHHIPVSCDFCGEFVTTVAESVTSKTSDLRSQFFDGIKKWNLEGVVNYLGWISGKEKVETFNKAHVFVLPTNFPWEGQPVSIIEAMAFGLPVISTHYRSIPEQVIDQYNGLLVEYHNPEQIANAVKDLWENPDKYNRFSANALLHYEENFTQEAHLNKLIPIIVGN